MTGQSHSHYCGFAVREGLKPVSTERQQWTSLLMLVNMKMKYTKTWTESNQY